MRITTELAALRHDPAPLLAGAVLTGEAARDWREGAAPAVLADLARYGAGTELGECPALAALVEGEGGEAHRVAGAGLGDMIAAMRAAPLAPVPWRHFTNGVLHSLVLGLAGRGSLSLALLDGPAWTATRDPRGEALASFQPGELHVRVLAGSGTARILRNRSDDPRVARIEAKPLILRPGASYSLDGAHEALAIDRIDGALVTLRLHRRPVGASVARQYEIVGGALVHQAAGLQDDSRAELAMALLRAMGRRDAAPAFAAFVRTGACSGEPAARWQAFRECLALDSAVGLEELCRVAETPDDPLVAPARALLEVLVARDPAFAKARATLLCPA